MLVFLGSLMLCVAIFSIWVDRVALDSGAWSDTSTKALQQPAVRTAVSEYLVDQLYANVNVPAALSGRFRPGSNRWQGRSLSVRSRISSGPWPPAWRVRTSSSCGARRTFVPIVS